MEIVKTLVFFSGYDEGHSCLIDTVQHEGKWWLVGSWLEAIATRERMPELLVRLEGLQYQGVEGQPYRFVLNNPIPKSVLDGKEQGGYVVVRFPALVGMTTPTSKQ